MSAIEWKRARGLRNAEAMVGATAYEGTTPYGVAYRVVSEPARGGREVRAYRVVGERLVPAAGGGALRAVELAKQQAEADLLDVLADRGTRILIRPLRPIIETVYASIGSNPPARWQWRGFEGADWFPTDVPFVDLFALEVDRDGTAALVCPCGEAVNPAGTLGEISDQAHELAAKHGKA